jgi:YHS domain
MLYRFWRGLVILLFGLFVSTGVVAQGSVNSGADKVAIKGYDTVAYFTEGKPVRGSTEFEYVWQDARWRFASAQSRDRFATDPDRYAPQYGGFCALGVAKGMKVEIDPEQWTIVNGKLYLNYSQVFRDQWRQDVAEHVRTADGKWAALSK